MMSGVRLAIISDTHAGASDPAIEDALVEDVAACRVDLLLSPGDLTQRARRAQFRHAAGLLERLPRAAVAVPGNHDQPLYDVLRRIVAPLARFRRVVGERPEAPVVEGPLAALGLATPRRRIPVNGEVSPRQLAAIAALGGTAAQLRVLITHHPLVTPWPDLVTARGSAEAMAAAGAAGVDVVAAGHHHRSGVHVVEAGGRRILALHAGTGTSVRVRREANAWLLVEVGPHGDRLDVEVRALADGAFGCAAAHRALRDPGGWTLSDA